MQNTPGQVGSILWCLVLSLLAACSAVQGTALAPAASPTATTSRPTVQVPTSAPSPTAFASETFHPVTPTSVPVSTPEPTLDPSMEWDFRTLQMIDAQKGWALAGQKLVGRSHLLRTEDGGVTWRDASPVYDGVFQSFFLDEQNAWLWTMNSAWRTQDGGNTWISLGNLGLGPDMWFNDPQHGWKMVAEYWGLSYVQFDIDSFTATQDGGLTWQDIPRPSDDGVLYMAYPTDRVAWALSAGFAKTLEGTPNLGVPYSIQLTLDGGSTWTRREMPLPPGAERSERSYEGTFLGGVGNCAFTSPVYSSATIWKLALTCETRSWMYTTTNQGETWIISAMPAGVDVRIQFVDPSNGWLFLGGWSKDFQGNLYRTTDGGESWRLIKRTGWGDIQMSFIDAQAGWAIACSQGYCYSTVDGKALVMTRDGGETWEEIEPRVAP